MSGRFLASLVGHKAMVLSLCFHPDGKTLVSGGTGEDGTLMWDLSYYDRHIAGNLEFQIGRLPAGTADPAEVARLRASAAEVAARPGAADDVQTATGGDRSGGETNVAAD